MSRIARIKKTIKSNYFFWRYWRNRHAVLAYRKPLLDQNSQSIVDSLFEKGIARGKFSELFPDIDFEQFRSTVCSELEKYDAGHSYSSDDVNKKYADFVLGVKPRYDEGSFWNKIATHPALKQIADSYFEMKGTEMRYYNIWRHRALSDIPTGSQLWHRDREDVKILKIFIHLEDVNGDNGPFYYATGTQITGRIQNEPEYFVESDGTRRTTDEMMSKLVPQSSWISSVGERGTVLFADTHGFHKGGFVEKGYRLLFTCMYVSPACERYEFV